MIVHWRTCLSVSLPILIGLLSSASQAQTGLPAAAFYVSPHGSDFNNGTVITAPFQSLERARAAARQSKTKTVCLLGGVYNRTSHFVLQQADVGQTWYACSRAHAIIDGGDTVDFGIAIYSGANITIRNLFIRRFAKAGIFAKDATKIDVANNSIENIRTDGPNEGGIVFLNNTSNVEIVHNLIRSSGYAGILTANNQTDSLKNFRVEYNAVYDSCLTISDCGAIYADDRSHGATGIVIKGNVIGNSRKPASKTEAIYLDDLLSNATVSDNIIYGPITSALQIHGGDHNVIENNIFDVSEAAELAIYDEDGPQRPNYGMQKNVVRCNIIYSGGDPPSDLWVVDIKSNDALPDVSSNLYWYKARETIGDDSVRDKSPTWADPGFANPSARDYRMSHRPRGCERSQVGPSTAGPTGF